MHDLNLGARGRAPDPPEPNAPLLEALDPEHRTAVTADDVPWWLREAPPARKKKAWPQGIDGSPAKVKLAYACMEKWHFRYRDKRPDPPGPEAVVGKLVHGALEDAALRRIARKRPVPPVASREELLRLLEHQPAQLLSEGDESQVLPSSLEDARSILAGLEGGVDFRYTLHVEHLWTLRVTVDFVVGGFIDRVDLIGADPERPQSVIVPDYKTWAYLPTRDDLAVDPQVGLYLCWARRRWPSCRDVRFVHESLRLRKRIVVEWNQGLDDFHLAQARAAHAVWSSGDRTPRPGKECTRCPYREGDASYKPCQAYVRELERTRLVGTEHAQGGLEKLSTPELLAVYREGSYGQKLQDERRKAAGAILRERLKGQRSYRHGDLLAIITQDELRSFVGVDAMIESLAEATGVARARLVADLLQVRMGRLDEWLKALPPEARAKAEAVVDRHVDTFPGAPELQVRRTQSMF